MTAKMTVFEAYDFLAKAKEIIEGCAECDYVAVPDGFLDDFRDFMALFSAMDGQSASQKKIVRELLTIVQCQQSIAAEQDMIVSCYQFNKT